MRFIDWIFEHVYLPSRRRWAQQRVADLSSRRDELYERLMAEVRRTEDAVRQQKQGPQ